MGKKSQQTVKLAIDCETEELITAESLLILSEAKFSELRRAAMITRVERKHGKFSVRFRCAICKQPVFLSRYVEGNKNRWFSHDGKSEQCPWYEKKRLTPEQTKALIYRGQQESAKHREYKRFLAHWLGNDPLVSEVSQEQTTFGEVMKGELRRPDVKCRYRGQPLVFEIQLSYTFLSDVIARDEFYRREGIFIVWVFASFDLNRAAVTDEAFFNRRNLFVLDADAMRVTEERGTLTFSGYRQSPCVIEDLLIDSWSSELITLSEVFFPKETFRPYFFDYDAERIKVLRAIEASAWQKGVQDYLDLAMRYYESDHANEWKTALLSKVDELEESGFWHRGFEPLREWEFYGWHSILSVLLSIKFGRPFSYNKNLSVYQVIEAGIRASHKRIGEHAYAILYLWAYKVYRPEMTAKNYSWLKNYAHKIKKSVDAGETTYQRPAWYDESICLLFPELEETFTTFGLFSHRDSFMSIT